MAKKKVWLAVGGVALSTLLTVGLVAGLLPEKKKKCDHVFDEGNVVVSATCTTDGKVVYTCTECGESEAQILPASHIDKGGEGVCDVCKEILVDPSTYTATAVSETDLCVGTWYRLDYTPATDVSAGSSSVLNFSNLNALSVGYHWAVGPAFYVSQNPEFSLNNCEFAVCIISDTYFDFCFLEPFSVTDPMDQETTHSILATTTWANPDATGFYKLVP